jgi:hypothetical protein
LFNEPAGQDALVDLGIPAEAVKTLPLLGISSICNLLAALKTARYYEMDEGDVLFTSLTDSVELYRTRLAEMTRERGAYTTLQAHVDYERFLLGATTDHLKELGFTDRKAIHNLKYFTWVEQQGRTVEELDALWEPAFWDGMASLLPDWDEAIRSFNADTGVLAGMQTKGVQL